MTARVIPLRRPDWTASAFSATPTRRLSDADIAAVYARVPPTPTSIRRRPKRRVVLVAVGVAGLLIAGGVALWPRASTPPIAAPAPPASSAPAVAEGLTWELRQGVYFPVSTTDGPSTMAGGYAAGFADTDFGAALAAVHIVYRASAAPGPAAFEAALRDQVIGSGVEQLTGTVRAEYETARSASDLTDGDPIGEGSATFLGYHVGTLPDGNRAVQIYEQAPDVNGVPQTFAFGVVMAWQDGDWKVVAPTSGTWSTAFSQLAGIPAEMIAFTPAAPVRGGR